MTATTNASVRALLAALEVEHHGRLGGRDRLATICFDRSVAVVPQDLAVSVLAGKWSAC